MKVANYYNNNDIRIEERPTPKIGAGELLIRIHRAGICGTDVMEWYRIGSTPRVIGHEVAGEIVEVGPGVVQYKKGDRVAASHHVPCYNCHYCKLGHQTLCDTIRQTNFDPGGFAELVRLPAINVRVGVYHLPDTLSYEEATLIEPLACTVRAQRKAQLKPEQTVLVLGTGPAGLLHLHLAKRSGAKRVIGVDVVAARLEVAKQFGADTVLATNDDLARRVCDVNEGRLADLVIVCSHSEKATRQALQLVERGGTVLFFAPVSPDQVIPMSMNEIFWQKGATLISSYAASPEDHHESLKLMSEKKVDLKRMITDRLPLAEIARGFQLVAKPSDSIKVIIELTK